MNKNLTWEEYVELMTVRYSSVLSTSENSLFEDVLDFETWCQGLHFCLSRWRRSVQLDSSLDSKEKPQLYLNPREFSEYLWSTSEPQTLSISLKGVDVGLSSVDGISFLLLEFLGGSHYDCTLDSYQDGSTVFWRTNSVKINGQSISLWGAVAISLDIASQSAQLDFTYIPSPSSSMFVETQYKFSNRLQ